MVGKNKNKNDDDYLEMTCDNFSMHKIKSSTSNPMHLDWTYCNYLLLFTGAPSCEAP